MFKIPNAVSIGVIVAGIAACGYGAAWGQTQDQLRERFRAECRAQFPHLAGPAHKEERFARVSACVRAKFATRAASVVSAPTPSQAEFKLVEARPWLVGENRGPADAKGIILFVRGYATDSVAADSFLPVPYFISTLSEKGWDTLAAKVPRSARGVRAVDVIGSAAAFMRRRVRELKAQGYKRVILAGHSWGAWGALLAAQDPEFAADALVLSAPITFGQRSNPNFHLNLTQFPAALNKVRTPTVVILPDDPVWDPDPDKRGSTAEKHFTQAEIPHLILAKPRGFTGHFAAWLPVFDYAYGRCIEAFIESPVSKSCSPPGLSVRDFRSIVDLKQLADAESKSITSMEPLTGKKFVIYALAERVTHSYEYISAKQRKHEQTEAIKSEEVSFRNGLHCAGGQCNKLIAWGEGRLLEFEPKGGKLVAWWVERK